MYPETNSNYGVVSTLTYGVQWDRTLAWWVETKAQNGTKDATISSNNDLNGDNSEEYANFPGTKIPNATFNAGASVSKDNGKTYTTIDSNYSKTSRDKHLLTTGPIRLYSVLDFGFVSFDYSYANFFRFYLWFPSLPLHKEIN